MNWKIRDLLETLGMDRIGEGSRECSGGTATWITEKLEGIQAIYIEVRLGGDIASIIMGKNNILTCKYVEGGRFVTEKDNEIKTLDLLREIARPQKTEREITKELMLMLAYQTSWQEHRDDMPGTHLCKAPRSYKFDLLDELDLDDFMKGAHGGINVIISKEGQEKARELLEKYKEAAHGDV